MELKPIRLEVDLEYAQSTFGAKKDTAPCRNQGSLMSGVDGLSKNIDFNSHSRYVATANQMN